MIIRQVIWRNHNCNRLPVLCQGTGLQPGGLRDSVSTTLFLDIICLATYFYYLFLLPIADCKRCLPRQLWIIVIILLPSTSCIYRDSRATFTIKSFMQFSLTAKLTTIDELDNSDTRTDLTPSIWGLPAYEPILSSLCV